MIFSAKRNNSPVIMDGAHVINLSEYKSIEARWIALFVNNDTERYFDSFGVEYTPKEIKKFIRNKKYYHKYL